MMGTRTRDDSAPPEDWEEIYTVTEISEAIKQSLESDFPAIHVIGEIANFKAHTSGHLYFSLRDESNLIRVVVFRRYAEALPFGPDNGMLVIASGRLSHYGGSGQTQLVSYRMTPAGRGGMELEFRELLQKLMREGLTAPERKRSVPPYPARLVVITSETGAVVRDICNTLERRWPVAEITHIGVAVQGDRAVPEITAAFERSNRLTGIDAVILARGGGSIEDLQAFNSEEVARAVAGSAHPVITGIGHEIDTTIADYVADLRAATPTAAAELSAPHIDDVRRMIDETNRRLEAAYAGSHEDRLQRLEFLLRSSSFPALVHRLEQAELKLDDAASKLESWWKFIRIGHTAAIEGEITAMRECVSQSLRTRETDLARLRNTVARANPEGRAAAARAGVENLLGELFLRTTGTLERARYGVDGAVRAIDGLHPRAVLKRGYTYCTVDGDDTVAPRIDSIRKGEDVTVHFYDGGARCTVVEKRKGSRWQKR